jgi:hypothetical protein
MKKATYEDIKRHFSKEDLAKYDTLSQIVVFMTNGKNDIQLWDMTQPGTPLRKTLDEIHALRGKYDFLRGETFFEVWRFDPETRRRETVSW